MEAVEGRFNLSLLARFDPDRLDQRFDTTEILHPRTVLQAAGSIQTKGGDLIQQCWDPLSADPSSEPPGQIAAEPCLQSLKPGRIETMTSPSQLVRAPGIQKQGIHAGEIGVDAVEIRFSTQA
ncbi:hypothetical protein MITS9509_00797 [Synechococcus sp. MIT S9509]|nr:hypothetical protein MITS9504_00940 [Synechococcus sp. MIT S9504]KZR92924.1 hypothetical protein MITS9509_00797 [Synechococcus sp. MIT S9509]